jgi:hypothetical protein
MRARTYPPHVRVFSYIRMSISTSVDSRFHVNLKRKIISVLDEINVYNVYTFIYTGFTGTLKCQFKQR